MSELREKLETYALDTCETTNVMVGAARIALEAVREKLKGIWFEETIDPDALVRELLEELKEYRR